MWANFILLNFIFSVLGLLIVLWMLQLNLRKKKDKKSWDIQNLLKKLPFSIGCWEFLINLQMLQVSQNWWFWHFHIITLAHNAKKHKIVWLKTMTKFRGLVTLQFLTMEIIWFPWQPWIYFGCYSYPGNHENTFLAMIVTDEGMKMYPKIEDPFAIFSQYSIFN